MKLLIIDVDVILITDRTFFSQEIPVNSNISPPTGGDPKKDGEGVSDSYVHLVPEMVKFVTHTSL